MTMDGWRAAAIAAAALATLACGSASTAARSPAGAGGIVTARSVDAGGAPAGVTSQFDHSKDTRVLVAVPTDGMPLGTTYSSVRFVDGRYLDTRTLQLTHPGRFLVFETDARPGHALVPGHFRYQVYRDRRLMGTVEFDVR